jgi:phage shock protein PspC (stress-responsive transcriptional regulator)
MDETEDVNDVSAGDVDTPVSDASPQGAKLHRSSTKKIFGGVAGGISDRFDMDANIVRVIFVVLALAYGLGVAIYLAMWLLIPKSEAVETGDVVAFDESSQPRRHWLRYAVALGVIVFALIMVAALQGGHRLGPGLSLLWLIFLVVLAVVSLTTPARRLTLRRFFALTFLGFLSFLILVTGVFLLSLQVIGVPLEGGSGTRAWHPTSPAEVQRVYHGAIGESTIDLSHVHFSPGTKYLTATQGVGILMVDLPANVSIDLRTHVGIGTVQRGQYFDPSIASGTGSTATSASSTTSTTRLVLNLSVGVGQLQLLTPIG